ncbi:11898_t:CDS:2, partial [Gigaspora rosea]
MLVSHKCKPFKLHFDHYWKLPWECLDVEHSAGLKDQENALIRKSQHTPEDKET